MPEGGTHERRSLIEQGSEPNDAAPFPPEKRTLGALREAAAGCRGCHLWRGATQTVFGEGLERGRPIESDLVPLVTATIHPSAILRAPADDARQAERAAFTADLRVVAEALG